ncbi:MFS transporter [Mycobacteroides franklinii]|uniref:MFS transporter n=1 Tax=Mycobacteroides franklinii TaxID=948102 RepID=UPI000993D3D2|nr:MFS transporter [Mycobacteroides franklinii]
MDRLNSPAVPQRFSAWRFVTTFGVISMLADIVYEGARSITGPLLASLGASALVVGVVTGIGEAAALALRLVSGPLTDRTRMFWTWTIAGYALTVITVPFLGVSSVLWVTATLVIAERVGKAVRSPAKDTLLSHATSVTGRGKGFAVHEAMDQVGAITGPLLVAGMLALTHVNYLPTFAVLAIPGAATLVLLFWLRRRVPHPERYEDAGHTGGVTTRARKLALPLPFWLYAGFTAITMVGFATFGVLSFHMVERGVLPVAAVPIVYAAAMAADAIAALISGWAYDRVGPKSLVALPIVGAAVPMLAFTDSLLGIVLGALLWGAAVGIQESTLRAVVADLVPAPRRATAYGVYAAVLGTATAIGGALTGYLYGISIPMLVAVVGVIQLVALIIAAPTILRHTHQV